MRDKGLLSQVEFDNAQRDIRETVGRNAAQATTLVTAKWATTFYGFVQADVIRDETRSLNEAAGSAQILRGGTQGGDNGRFTFSVRNSRIGFRMKPPEVDGIRTSVQVEMDFLGNQPSDAAEGSVFGHPTFRLRHAYFRVETPILDILVGQYWQLFGWQGSYFPNTVQIQGIPGELFGRTPQLRVSKTLKFDPVSVEIAAAALRPAQRDSGTPDGQGGIRVALHSWTGLQTIGSTGTQIAPLSVAVTGYVRHVNVNDYQGTGTQEKVGTGLAIDGYIPIIPATQTRKSNALSLNGEWSTGYGDGDLYTGSHGGFNTVASSQLPANSTYVPNIDRGIVSFDATGGLHFIQWTTYLIGAQYYFPGVDGRFWISGNYSHTEASPPYATPATARAQEDWFDVNVFADLSPVRVGAEYSFFSDKYGDGARASNRRIQLSGFFLF
jgi:hypothetical protein